TTPINKYATLTGAYNLTTFDQWTTSINNIEYTTNPFVNSEGKDYHLLPNSVARNGGSNDYKPQATKVDLDGNDRVQENIIDIGAYEYTPPVKLATPVILTCVPTVNSISLTWSPVARASGYKLEYSLSLSFPTRTTSSVTIDANTSSYTISNLPSNTKYYIRIKALGGNSANILDSEYSAIRETTTFPEVPRDFKASVVSQHIINLSWNAPSNGADWYKLEFSLDSQSWTQIGGQITATMYRHSELESNTLYYYRLAAVNVSGMSEYTSVISTRTNDLTPVPTLTDLEVSYTSGSTARVTWSAVTPVFGYAVQYSPDSTFATEIETKTVSSTTTYCDCDRLKGNTTYYFRVIALGNYSTYGDSEPSTAKSILTYPDRPADFHAVAQTSNSITLSWDMSGTANITFTLEYRQGDSTDWIPLVYHYAMSSYTHTGLTANSVYSYRIQAINATGGSPYAILQNVKTSPDSPLNPRASVDDKNQITVSWEKPSSGADYYTLEYSLDGQTGWVLLLKTPTETSFYHTQVKPNTTYYYRIAAANASGISAYSKVHTKTNEPPRLPAPSFEVTGAHVSVIDITWTPIEIATGYQIQWTDDATFAANVQTIAVDATESSCKCFYLDSNSIYYFRMSAIGDGITCRSSVLTEIQSAVTYPTRPNTFYSTKQTANSISLAWAPQLGDGVKYRLDYAEGKTFDWVLLANDLTTTEYVHTNVKKCTTYRYRLSATNETGNSANHVIEVETDEVEVIANLTGSQSEVQEGCQFYLDASQSQGTGLTYYWDFLQDGNFVEGPASFWKSSL
ncbi:MAG: fibronectin type III domain-containing protein, partial [Planctomycetia bacterium]|nr:fibronectin type III domain-containing protein [Planctomycetia bacterium]